MNDRQTHTLDLLEMGDDFYWTSASAEAWTVYDVSPDGKWMDVRMKGTETTLRYFGDDVEVFISAGAA